MVEEKLCSLPGVATADVSLRAKCAVLQTTRQVEDADIAAAVEAAGYSVGIEKAPWLNRDPQDWKRIGTSALLVGLAAFLVVSFGPGQISVGSPSQDIFIALLVGLTAGFSTCMALVGGLVLGLSARHAETHPNLTRKQAFTPHLLFNASRIVAFFILGGLAGIVGSVFQFNGVTLGVLTIIIGIVMLTIGLRLANIFPRFNGGIVLPPKLARLLGVERRKNAAYSNRNALTLGVLSFFLPCGFTQAMQLYAISTGDFVSGALVMGLFAIGTTPGLLTVGGAASFVKDSFRRSFFTFAGVAVIALAFVNISNGYVLTGWRIFPAATMVTTSDDVTSRTATPEGNILRAVFELPSPKDISAGGYPELITPSSFEVEAGQTYTLEIEARDDGVGCMSTILIPGLVNTPQLLTKGTVHKLVFAANKPGTYSIACAMGVPFGELTIREKTL